MDLIAILNLAAAAAVPPRERLELLGAVEQWVAEQKRIAFAQLERIEGNAPPAPPRPPGARGEVLDADFE